MDIKEMQKLFQQDASGLGDYQLMSKTELANGYCDAEEAARQARAEGNEREAELQDQIRSQYYSALMLRYWYKIFEWAQNSASLNLEMTDFVDWLSDSLYVAFFYRTWRWEYEATVRHGVFEDWKRDQEGNLFPNKYYWRVDPNAPDKIINRCCGSMRGRVYQYHNKDKRKAAVQTYSLDQMIEDAGDSAVEFSGCYVEAPSAAERGIYSLITELLHRDEGIEALIIDGIANYETYKTHKNTYFVKEIDEESGEEVETKYVQTSTSFDSRKLVKHLTHIYQDFMRQFCVNYSIPLDRGDDIYTKLKKLSNPKLYKYIEKTLIEIRQTPQLLDWLS